MATDKPTAQFNRRLNDIALRIVLLQAAKSSVPGLPLSKTDKSALCSNLEEEIAYRIGLLTHTIERGDGPWKKTRAVPAFKERKE